MLEDKDRFFPASFTFRSCEGWEEERELFGIMDHVGRPELTQQQRTPQTRRSTRKDKPTEDES
eukprot:gene5394-16669_t